MKNNKVKTAKQAIELLRQCGIKVNIHKGRFNNSRGIYEINGSRFNRDQVIAYWSETKTKSERNSKQ